MSNVDRDPSAGGLPIESNDDAALRMLGGAIFGPNARLILPSGIELSGSEAQAFTGAFADPAQDLSHEGEDTSHVAAHHDGSVHDVDSNPLSSRHDAWTGEPEADRRNLVARALRAILRKNV